MQIKLKKFDINEIKNNLAPQELYKEGVSVIEIPEYVEFLVGTFKDAKTVKTFLVESDIDWDDEKDEPVMEQYAVVILKAKCWKQRKKLYPEHLTFYPVTIMPMAQLWRKTDTGWQTEDTNQWLEDSAGDEWMPIGDHLDTLLSDNGFYR
jgi:hypothetical protein